MLEDLKNLLTAPHSWFQGEYADDPDSPTCWCVDGAVAHLRGIQPNPYYLDRDPTLQTLAKIIEPDEANITRVGASAIVARFNDSHTHEEVLALLDKAIASC